MKPVRISFSVVLALLLAACTLMPAPVSQSQRPANLSAQTASDSQSTPSATGAQGVNQKTVTFPDRVTKTALADPEPSEVDELSALLASFQAEEAADFSTASEKNKDDNQDDKGHDSHAAYVLEFKSKKAKGKRQILMPETGEFKLTLTAGPRFELLDNDARDGEARVQMPASTLKTWVHLDESRNGGSLEVSDELYYVKDTLSKERKKHKRHADARYNTWFKLGLRPLPVPSDWHSPDGQSFVLRFKAQQVQEFQLIWQKRRESAPFPPGVAEIGPEGGQLELPGVAELEIPAGAILTKTVLSVRQEKEGFADMLMLSPIIRFEPFGLKLEQPALIRMNLNKELLGKNHPSVISYDFYLTENNIDGASWSTLNTLEENIKSINLNSWYELPLLTKVFVNLPWTAFGHEFQPQTPEDFSIQSTPFSSTFAIFDEKNQIPSQNYINLIYDSLSRAWSIYVSKFNITPIKHKNNKIPVYITDKYTYLGQTIGVDNGTVINHDNLTRPNNWTMLLAPQVAGLGYSGPSFAVVAQHELFHVFQNSLLPGHEKFKDAAIAYTLNNGWLLESSARYMGYRLTFDDVGYYSKKYSNIFNITETNKIDEFYTNVYGLNLIDGIKNNIIPVRTMFESPEGNLEKIYARNNIISAIAQHEGDLGLEKIVKINATYAKGGKGLDQAVSAINTHFNLQQNMLNLAAGYFKREYGLGTESVSNVDKIEKNLNKDLNPVPVINRDQAYVKHNTQIKQFFIPYEKLPAKDRIVKAGSARFYEIVPSFKDLVEKRNELPKTFKNLMLYIDKDPASITAEEINSTRVFLHQFNTVGNHYKPILDSDSGHVFKKQNIYAECPNQKLERYAYKVNNFVDNFDKATIIVANGSMNKTKEVDFPLKAFIPVPKLCGIKKSANKVEFKGQYLAEVKALRLQTDKGEKTVSVDEISEDGAEMTATLPSDVKEVYLATGITCEGNALQAYVDQGFKVAQLSSGPSCGCIDCTETNGQGIPPVILEVTYPTQEEDPSGSQIIVKTKHCNPNDCSIIFENRENVLPFQQKVNIKKTLTDSSGETVQEIWTVVPNVSKINGSIYASSGNLRSNLKKDAIQVCNIMQDGFAISNKRPCLKTT